ncbi:hypothetical protein F5H01DRAFT_373704 [Linnemannia elongata]|nr:hypothetical protein F5H01DRAFT_373704 [Linnemannia elongata]
MECSCIWKPRRLETELLGGLIFKDGTINTLNKVLRYTADTPGLESSLSVVPSPDTAAANNLLTFMGQRYAASWVNLGCDKILKKTSDITVTTDKQGVAIKVHFHQSKPIRKHKNE